VVSFTTLPLYPLAKSPRCFETEWAPETVWTLWRTESLALPEIELGSVVQPVAHRYTD
jgi:hypothetical protein